MRSKTRRSPWLVRWDVECDSPGGICRCDAKRNHVKADLNVRVGIKETAPPRQVCYYFNHTMEEIEEQVRLTAKTTVLDDIKKRIGIRPKTRIAAMNGCGDSKTGFVTGPITRKDRKK